MVEKAEARADAQADPVDKAEAVAPADQVIKVAAVAQAEGVASQVAAVTANHNARGEIQSRPFLLFVQVLRHEMRVCRLRKTVCRLRTRRVRRR